MGVTVQSQIEKAVIVSSDNRTIYVKKVEVGIPVRKVTSGSNSITNLNGVDVSSRIHGSWLMYDSSQQLFVAQTEVNSSNNKINGGNY